MDPDSLYQAAQIISVSIIAASLILCACALFIYLNYLRYLSRRDHGIDHQAIRRVAQDRVAGETNMTDLSDD